VLHAKVLPGNPYDGHTLRVAIERTELTGREIERAYVDKEYCGHDAWKTHTATSHSALVCRARCNPTLTRLSLAQLRTAFEMKFGVMVTDDHSSLTTPVDERRQRR